MIEQDDIERSPSELADMYQGIYDDLSQRPASKRPHFYARLPALIARFRERAASQEPASHSDQAIDAHNAEQDADPMPAQRDAVARHRADVVAEYRRLAGGGTQSRPETLLRLADEIEAGGRLCGCAECWPDNPNPGEDVPAQVVTDADPDTIRSAARAFAAGLITADECAESIAETVIAQMVTSYGIQYMLPGETPPPAQRGDTFQQRFF